MRTNTGALKETIEEAVQKPAGFAYRRDIDGLRAIAVIGVVLFHLDPAYVPGGFLGVDVFFVISGYLITGIIRRGIDLETFSLRRFYEKRITRLMPALLVVTICVSAFAWQWMWPSDFKDFSKSVKYVFLSLANVHFLKESEDYFGPEAINLPMLHTWSLAVEEQYYLIFPLLLVVLKKRFSWEKGVVNAMWILFVLSLGACVLQGMNRPMAAFFLLPYRGWELLVGSLLALGGFRQPSRVQSVIAGIAGVLLIAASFIFISDRNFTPGLMAVPVCLGAALLIFSGREQSNFICAALSWRPLVWTGLVSYSLYLWHWPLIVFADRFFPFRGVAAHGTILVASAVLAWLSWRFVEQPFRVRGRFNGRRIFGSWALITVAAILFAVLIRKQDGVPGRFPNEVVEMLGYAKPKNPYKVQEEETYNGGISVIYGDRTAIPHIALWGDSHAEALLPALDEMGISTGKSLLIYKLPAQVPVPDFVLANGEGARREDFTRTAWKEIMSDGELKTVVLHARWSWPIWGCEIGEAAVNQRFVGISFKNRGELTRYYGIHLKRVIDGLLAAGKRVVVIYPVPELATHATRHLAYDLNRGRELTRRIPCEDYIARNSAILKVLDSYPETPRLLKIRPADVLLKDRKVMISKNGKPVYRDTNHLSAPGSALLKESLEPIF